MSTKKTRARRRAIRELDAMTRDQVFQRDVRCVRCNSTENLQWCHILDRRHLFARWEPENSVVLCSGCHLFWHHEPLLSTDWFRKNFPERFDRLIALATRKPTTDPQDVLATLRADSEYAQEEKRDFVAP